MPGARARRTNRTIGVPGASARHTPDMRKEHLKSSQKCARHTTEKMVFWLIWPKIGRFDPKKVDRPKKHVKRIDLAKKKSKKFIFDAFIQEKRIGVPGARGVPCASAAHQVSHCVNQISNFKSRTLKMLFWQGF